MNALVSLEPEVEDGLMVIVQKYPKDGMIDLLQLMSQLVECILARLNNRDSRGWDENSIKAIDDFIHSSDEVLVCDNGRVYFTAEHGAVGTAILITNAGVFDEKF